MNGIFGIYSPDNIRIDDEEFSEIFKRHHFKISNRMVRRHSVFFGLTSASSNSSSSISVSSDHQLLCCGGLLDSSISLEKKAIDLFKEKRYDGFQDLEGSFVLVRIDEQTLCPQIVNDRNGQIRIFYCVVNGQLIISSRFLLLLEFLDVKTVNPQALASFLLFGYPLEQDTLLSEVKVLPPGSVLSFDDKTVRVHRYYHYSTNGGLDDRSEDDLIETLHDHWRNAVAKRIVHDQKNLVLLSGGLDSRAILAEMLTQTPKDNIITASYGEKSSYDLKIAQNIAEKNELKHHVLEKDEIDYESQFHLSFDLVDGMIDVTPYYPIHQYKELNDKAAYAHSGLMGGELMGPLIFSKIDKNHTGTSKKDMLFHHHIINNVDTVRSILHPDFRGRDVLFGSFDESVCDLDEISDDAFYQYCASWMYRNETYKYTSYCNLRWPYLFSYQTPFYDHDLMDFMFSVPVKYRVDKTLFKKMLLKKYPELFSIPTKNSFGLPPTSSPLRIFLRRVMLGGLTRLNTLSTRILKRNLFVDPLENYIDYDDLIRTNKAYQKFIKRHLDHVKQFSFFDETGIERIWDDHLKGKKQNAYLFGLLVSFDLFMKNYVKSGKT